MYTLDTQSARNADNKSNYLSETGKYKGVFTRAEKLISANKGTHGIGFTFEDMNKRSTRFDVWTMNNDDKRLQGYDALMAIMTCLRVKSLSATKAVVEKYNYDTRKNESVQATVFGELMNKPVGLLLRNTEYEKMLQGVKTGETAWRLELYMVFDAETEMTASEILDKKTQAEKLPEMIATLKDKPLKNKPVQKQSGGEYVPGDDFGDDLIPF